MADIKTREVMKGTNKDVRPGRGSSTSHKDGSTGRRKVQRKHIRQKKTRHQDMRRAGSQEPEG